MMFKTLANRWIHFFLLLVLLLSALFLGFSNHPFPKELQYTAFDALNRAYPRPPADQVIIADIDDDSLKELGQWPWPRTTLADLVTSLTALGAKAIAFDGVLAEPDRTSPNLLAENLPEESGYDELKTKLGGLRNHDDILAEAIQSSGIFVSAFSFGSYEQTPEDPRLVKQILAKDADQWEFLNHAQFFKKAATFLPNLEQAAAGNGSFMAFPEHDGILRKTSLIFSNSRALYPSLSLEALRVAVLGPKGNIQIARTPAADKRQIDTEFRLVIGNHVIPVDKEGLLWLYFRAFDFTRDYVSAYKILHPDQHPDAAALIKDRIVFIGSSAEGLKDLRNTPLALARPGVEIHANAVEQILQDKYLVRPDVARFAEQGFILVVGLLMIVLAPFVNVIILGVLCAGLIALIIAGAVAAYVQFGILFDPVYPSLSVFAIFMASTILTYLRVEAERRQVRTAFGLYISRDFMRELTKNPDKLKLGGEIKDLTVMFTDIRSFTTISEGLSPEELIQLMNDFLTPMSDLVMQNRGTIDKYMGDAMMAFWNAPLDDAQHARHACTAALSMQAALEPINDALRKKAEGTGRAPVFLKAGIGINTGPCAVGNMGSRQRFAYSALGDTVNLASRLEGQTKTYGVSILMGEHTYRAAPNFAALEMDAIKVKGKEKPERIYALLGDEEESALDTFAALYQTHQEMLEAYRARRFEEALELAKACREMQDYGLDAAYMMYKERLRALIKNPPDENWDGVYEAKTK